MTTFYTRYPPTSGGGGGSGTVTSVDVSGGATGLTTSGGPITTSGVITLSGTLAISHGGTGQTTANNALNALLPTQTTSSGKFLTTDGTNTSWATAGSGSGTVTSVDVSGGSTGLTTSGGPVTTSGTITIAGTLNVGHGGTGATTFTVNGVLYGNTTSAVGVTAAGTTGQVLTATTGSAPTWAAPATSGTVTSVAVSGGSTGLTTSGGPITSSGTITLAGTLVIANGGTGQTTAVAAFNALNPMTTTGDIIYEVSTGTATRLPIGSTNQILTVVSGLPAWASGGGGASGDMLANFVNSANAYTNPSAQALSANTWSIITASSACSGVLPTPTAGHVIGVRILPTSTQLFTLSSTSGNIDGASTRIMWAAESAVLVADGTNWYKVAGKSCPMACTMRLNATTSGGYITYQTVKQILLNSADTNNTGLMSDPTTNHNITIIRAGIYVASGVVIFTNNSSGALTASGTRMITQLQKNAAGICNAEGPGQTGGLPAPFATLNVTCALTDVFTLNAFQNTFLITSQNQDAYGAALGADAACQLSLLEVPEW